MRADARGLRLPRIHCRVYNDAFLAVTLGQLPTLKYPNCSYPGFDGESDGPTWQLGLDYQLDDDTLIYGVTRRGYKSGGTNPVVTILSPLGQNDPLFAFKPEEVTDLEFGFKRDWQLCQVPLELNAPVSKPRPRGE